MSDLQILAAAGAVNAQGLEPEAIRPDDGLVGNVGATSEEQHVASPTALGFDSTGWVGIAALVVLIGMVIWKVPHRIGAMLDSRIAEIRKQLDEASALRREAEALKAEYEAKAASAQADAESIRSHAHSEAQAILVKAKASAEELMDRRARMAEDRIAAAERAALDEVRAKTAAAAAAAASTLIAQHHGADADNALVDKAIAGIGRPN